MQILLIGLNSGERLPAFDALPSETWPECVHLCLQAADWASVPRYRSIVVRRWQRSGGIVTLLTSQTVLLYIPMAFLRMSMVSFQLLPAFMAAVTRLAITLEWHKLGSDASIMPKPAEDPGLPFGQCSIRRQFALVAWNNIQFGAYVSPSSASLSAAQLHHGASSAQRPGPLCCAFGHLGDSADLTAQSRGVRHAVPLQRRASLSHAGLS